MYEIDLDKIITILSALVLGSVSGWYMSYRFKAKFSVTLLTTLVGTGLMGWAVFHMI